jgi:hypothetical protein|tara:strand:- start:1223 stop:1480 length:258 start_codon:yes stop_codon:yes gene_type:complete
MNNNINKLYDIEDDIIDRGDASNLSEELNYYNIDNSPSDINLNQKIEADYHNTYYSKGKYETRTLRMKNKQWHKLNKYDNSRKIK